MSGWHATLVWPEFLQDDETDVQFQEWLGQPEFADENWALWRNEILEDVDALLRHAGCAPMLTWAACCGVLTKDAVEPRWVSPDDLIAAVAAARSLMENPASAAIILRDYEDYGERGKPKEQSFTEDLAIIEAKARWARDRAHLVVSFDVNNGTN